MKSFALILNLFKRSAKVQKKRMVMTISAIAWGTLSIVLLLSFGEGMRDSFKRGGEGMGEGLLIVWPGETAKAFQGFPAGRAIRPTAEDVDLIKTSLPELDQISAEMIRWGVTISYGEKSLNKKVTGVETTYGDLRAHYPVAGGRFLNPLDEQLKRRVVFLGDNLAKDLFGADDPVGKTVSLNNQTFTVVGVMAHKLMMSNYSGQDKDHAVIPLSTYKAMFSQRRVSNLVLKPQTPEQMPAMKASLHRTLGGKYRYDPEDDRALQFWDTVETQGMMNNVGTGIEIFLGLIGGLTLLIGAVGVANIMYAVVKQRTKQIGVQMALGAKPYMVMGPLVLESLALTFVGGLIGILGGLSINGLLAFIQSQAQNEVLEIFGNPSFSLPVALTTVALLGTLGFLSGYFPARKAASIQPATVLRTE